MKFVEYDYKKLKKYNKLFNLITDFQKSELKCAKLENWNYACAEVGARAINGACKRYNVSHIKAIVSKGEIFLINDAISEG